MDRFTKLALTGSTCAAAAFQVWLLHGTWTELPWLAFGGALICGGAAWLDRRAIGLVLVTAYVYPVIVMSLRGVVSPDYDVIWMAALLGAMMPDLLRAPGWRMPARWRGPLAGAGLVVVASVLIVFVRETEGHPGLLLGPPARFWPIDAWFLARWTLHVALSLLVGLLFFESLFSGDVDVERAVVPALGVSALLMAGVAVYQRFVDAHFLNGTVFEVLGRATGTMYDANVMGIVAAFWIGGVTLWGVRGARWRIALTVPAVAMLLVAVWASGSRTSLAAAGVTLLGIGAHLSFRDDRLVPRRVAAGLAVAAVLVAAGAVYATTHRQAGNALSRMRSLVAAHPTPGALLGEIWNRNRYGTIATAMIRESPVAGVGVGAFHTLSQDYGARLGRPIAPDNAQNWLRHQVAEFGLVGALGWVVWTAMFAFFVFRIRRSEPSCIWIARGTLVAFGAISLVGMPGQSVMVGVTFWTFAYWYCRLAGVAGSTAPTRAWVWAVVALLLAAYVAASVPMIRTFRPATRARLAHRGYGYGVGPVLDTPPYAGYRQLNADAAIIDYPGRPWMKISLRRAETTGREPVDVRVSVDGDVVMKGRLLPGGSEFSAIVRVPDSTPTGILLETDARPARTSWWIPPKLESDVLIRWEFSDEGPADHRKYERMPRP